MLPVRTAAGLLSAPSHLWRILWITLQAPDSRGSKRPRRLNCIQRNWSRSINVNNTTYFRYLETARIDWFRSIGCPVDPRGEGALIVNAFCTFHQQLEYPGEIEVKLYASDPGRSSFESWATIERVDDPGVVYASGGATTVWVDFPQQKSVAMPAWLREIVGGGAVDPGAGPAAG